MSHYVTLRKDGVSYGFYLFDYDEAQGGGRLHKVSTLEELQLATLKFKHEGGAGFVTVPFTEDGYSLVRIRAGITIEVSGQAAAAAQAGGSLSGATSTQLGGASAEQGILQELTQLVQALHVCMGEVKQDMGEVKEAVGLVMFGQCRPVSSTSSKDDKKYRNNAIRYYYGDAAVSSTTIKCMVTGQELPSAQITAAHVFRKQWPSELLEQMGKRINDPTNLLLVRNQIEKKLDSFEVAIIPESEDDFRIVVLRPTLLSGLEKNIGAGTAEDNMTWGQVNGQLLHIKGCCEGARPARRILAFHALRAISWADTHGWIKKGDVTVPKAGWESPGYDPGLMRTYLEQQAAGSGGDDPVQD